MNHGGPLVGGAADLTAPGEVIAVVDGPAPFADELRRLRNRQGLSLRSLAAAVHHSKSYLHDLESGRRLPTEAVARRLDDALHASGRLTAQVRPAAAAPDPAGHNDSEVEALELIRRVSASDVSEETLRRLETVKDQMAMAYAATPPDQLLPRVRRHLAYAASLVDVRMTLVQHRRLIVIGGWLALLRATLHIDVRQAAAADAYLATAGRLAGEAEHTEIAAWCLETRAWDVLIRGDFKQALLLAQGAQAMAPRSSSAYVQASAQEGRAWARLGDRAQTSRVLNRVETLAGHLAEPDHPEHHYQYDPAKAHAYAATTLAWAGDPAAEIVARDVIAELETEAARPRRIASAHLDLGLALLAAGKPDEAVGAASQAIGTGRVVPSNWWRATEIMTGVQRAGAAEGRQLREQYEAYRPV